MKAEAAPASTGRPGQSGFTLHYTAIQPDWPWPSLPPSLITYQSTVFYSYPTSELLLHYHCMPWHVRCYHVPCCYAGNLRLPCNDNPLPWHYVTMVSIILGFHGWWRGLTPPLTTWVGVAVRLHTCDTLWHSGTTCLACLHSSEPSTLVFWSLPVTPLCLWDQLFRTNVWPVLPSFHSY